MKAVGIKVLKDNLSKYLKMVREGETVLVTDRDEVVAEIHRPTRPVAGHITPLEAFLTDEERQGKLQRAARTTAAPIARLRELPRPRIAIRLQQLLDELKAD